MNVKEILTQWLKENGYGGLYNDFECGCILDDLCPCDVEIIDCMPGYKVKSGDTYYPWTISPEKPKDPQ